MRNNHHPFFRIFSYLGMWLIRLFSIWAFNAANASMSPKVVAAAWF